ncbi:Rrf2 family transcriptional regulator [Bacteriovoracaceae bacterium]|nr:Rrf2 family transcriptional regulator [Bacteriovoracaceae bacterium]
MKDRSFATALHLMTSISFHQGERVCSDVLATGAKTNAGLVRRLLSKLSQAGLVDCQKGKNGGTVLARKPKDISLGDIYEAISETPLFASFDKDPHEPCPVSCQIGDVLTEVFEEIEKPMITKMKAIKLSKIIERIK